jgi:nucleotide sugar dehydrogenase
VVVGLGYVGLPLVVEIALAGYRATGLDRDPHVAAGVAAGRSHIDDVSADRLHAALAAGLATTTDPACLDDADVVVVCVPTPLADDGSPDLGAITEVGRLLAVHVRDGALVVLESTTYPGTTEELFGPLIEAGGRKAGVDFHLAFSPERVDPGNTEYGIRNTPKVVGGLTPECGDAAQAFYGSFVERVVRAKGTREAEMAKLLENTYRHINIALVNEMAQFSHELGIDLWNVIECAATKPFGFQAFYPGPGVGGHCIPIDPNYLSHRVRSQLHYPFRFVELAQEVNAAMPEYVARRIQDHFNSVGVPVRGSRVLLLGVTYKADVADERESPAVALARKLHQLGAVVGYHDPYVPAWTVPGLGERGLELTSATDLAAATAEADLVVLLQAHTTYLDGALAGVGVFDTRGCLDGPDVIRL